jgi:RNA polymerase sigma-32 factor
MQVATVVTKSQSSRVSRDHANQYALTVRRYDLLEANEEQELARRWHDLRDQRAVDVLVTSHLRLARKIAKGYMGYGLPLADLIAEANVGLVLAASKFEAGHGSRFSTYATWWIKANIHEYILRSWSMVKIGTTAAQKKLFFRLRGEMRKLQSDMSALTPEVAAQIAEKLAVTPRDVIEMDRRLNGDLSLNAPVNSEDSTVDWQDLLEDTAPNAEAILAENDETTHQAGALHAAMDVLNARERRVFEARRLSEDPPTLEELAQELSLSGERIRQIEMRAFLKVKQAARQLMRGNSGGPGRSQDRRSLSRDRTVHRQI